MSEFLFSGLVAANILSYLAALGTLRSASLVWKNRNVQMEWIFTNGGWRPRLSIDGELLDQDGFVGLLNSELKNTSKLKAINIGDDLTLKIESFRDALLAGRIASTFDDRRDVDFFAAFGCEVVEAKTNGKPNGLIADTAFRTMSGAGHQHFLGTVRTFINDTSPEHLATALFDEWRYEDPLEKHSMRWDPMDDIRYALRWENPSGDRKRKHGGSVWGANRLAIESLPLFPVVPVLNRVETTGFTEGGGVSALLTWPIWTGKLSIQSVRSLLSLGHLQEAYPDSANLASMGIVEVFRCERITKGKFRNFTTARPV